MDTNNSLFKVIIAGGSLVGLGLALCFERVGIDYVLLEKGEIGPQLGASIGIHPHAIKILEQLGVWKDIEKVVTPLLYRQHFDEYGKCFEDSKVLSEIKQRYADMFNVRFGVDSLLMHPQSNPSYHLHGAMRSSAHFVQPCAGQVENTCAYRVQVVPRDRRWSVCDYDSRRRLSRYHSHRCRRHPQSCESSNCGRDLDYPTRTEQRAERRYRPATSTIFSEFIGSVLIENRICC